MTEEKESAAQDGWNKQRRSPSSWLRFSMELLRSSSVTIKFTCLKNDALSSETEWHSSKYEEIIHQVYYLWFNAYMYTRTVKVVNVKTC